MEEHDGAFEGYRLLERLRGGSTPGIWKAQRIDDGATVVLKVFDVADAARAEREAEITATVAHPHVVAPLGSAVSATAVAVVLPWYPAGSLADLIAARRRLRWAEALTVLIPLADALAAAHERGFVHGDVSLANVLFDSVGRPLLGDFGAARAAAETGAEVYATACDVAPEIVRGAVPGPHSDLFSLGSVALACLTGRSAWFADDLQDVLIQSTAGQWPDLDEQMAPAVLRVLVRRLLAPEPADRGSAAALAVELRRVGQPEPVELVPHSAFGAPAAIRAATTVRPDAVRPPAADWRPPPGPGRARLRAAALRARRLAAAVGGHLSWRGAMAAAAVAALASGALLFGWSSAGTSAGQAAPGAAGVVIDRSGAPDPGDDVPDPVVDGSAAPGADADASPVAAAEAVEPDPGSAEGSASDDDWLRVMTGLDAARAAALVARDESLLADVYVPGAQGRMVDAARIAAMRAAGVHVKAATHTVNSVALVDLRPDGGVTLQVTESQASATIYDEGDVLLGSTEAVPETTRLVRLEPAEGGFRIDRIETR